MEDNMVCAVKRLPNYGIELKTSVLFTFLLQPFKIAMQFWCNNFSSAHNAVKSHFHAQKKNIMSVRETMMDYDDCFPVVRTMKVTL